MARSGGFNDLMRLLKMTVLQQSHGLSKDALRDRWSRRDFIKGSVVAGICAAVVAVPKRRWAKSSQPTVIVGAGVAGLTLAHRLAQRGHPAIIYEGSERLGGRMYTQRSFNSDRMFCERGGELVDSDHQDLASLCRELDIPLQDLGFAAGASSRSLYYAEGSLRSEASIVAAFAPLAQLLRRDIRYLSIDGRMLFPTYQSRLAGSPDVQRLDRLSLSAYLQSADLEPWLTALLSSCYTSEFGLDTSEQSALNLILMLEPVVNSGFAIYGSSDESRRIYGGSSRLPEELGKRLFGRVAVEYRHRLLKLADRLTHLQLTFEHHGRRLEIKADQVVLAMPLAVLRDIQLEKVALSPVKSRAIREWGIGTNSKLSVGYKEPTWRGGALPSCGRLYSDLRSQVLWDSSLQQSGKAGIMTALLGGESGRVPRSEVFEQAKNDLKLIDPNAACDDNHLLHHWPSDPYAKGSYATYRPGQYTGLAGAFTAPELSGRLHFAGEHRSVFYGGFMNGAVQSGNEVAAQILRQRI